jgi:hypothetical protein
MTITIHHTTLKRARNTFGASLAAAAVLAAGGPAFAQAGMPLQMSYPNDATMACEQIASEMSRMDQAMGLANSEIGSAEGAARATEAAASLGMQAALRSGALSRMPGLGQFANAAASAARAAAAAKAERGAQNIQVAQQRRAIMAGLYQGRACASNPMAIQASMVATPASAAAPAAPNTLAASQDVSLRASAAPTAAIVGSVKTGGVLYPTGNRNGVWVEVDDENGARGWMSSAFAKPR